MSGNVKKVINQEPVEYHPIFPGKRYEDVQPSQFSMPTIPMVIFLILVFVVLKKFIYITDEKRDGK